MIYMFIAPGFEEIEAIAPLDILRRAELDIQTVGIGGKSVTGAHGISIACDIADTDAVTDGLEMVILPGGMPGTLNLEKSQVVQRFLDYAQQQELWIAAICAAPSILGHKGMLKGKKATCFPGYETQLEGAEYTAGRVVRDGRYITAKGAGAALQFGFRLVELLIGRERAELLEASMQ